MDQQKNQNTNVTYVSNGGQPLASDFGVVAEPGSEALSLDPSSLAEPPPDGIVASVESHTNVVIRLLKRADVLLIVLLVMGMVGLVIANVTRKSRAPAASANITDKYGTVTLPLDGFVADGNGVSFGASSVVINGSLKLNDGLVVTPSVQPSTPKSGQLYFDQNTSQLAYYNGTAFVSLAAQGPVVQSIGGATGALTLGGGLSVVGNQLVSAVPGVDTNKVTSLGGVRGDISVGTGLKLSGNALQNAGVLSIAAGSNISVTQDGNGNYTVTNTGAGTGTVTSSGSSAGSIAMFDSAQNITDSLISQSGTMVTVTGDLNVVTGGLSLGNALTVSNGGTGATSLADNGVVISHGTAAFTTVVAGAPGLCLLSTAGAPSWGACPSASGVTSVNSLTGALTVANASASGSTITIDNATTSGTKGIASFNATNFTAAAGVVNTIQDINTTAAPAFGRLTVTSSQAAAALLLVNNTNAGATGNLLDLQLNGTSRFSVQPGGNVTASGTINGQTISSSASFTGTLGVAGNTTLSGTLAVNGGTISSTGALAVTPGGALTVGASAQTLGLQGNNSSTIAITGGGNTTTVSFQAPTANVTYRVPTAAAGSYDFCTTAGNCTGVGGGVTTAGGTANRLAKFSAAQTVADSTITDNGTLVSTTANLAIQGGTATVGVANSQTGSLVLAYGSANFTGTVTPGALTANRTYTLPDQDGTVCLSSGNCLGGASGGANTSLSNLTSVAINTSLLPGGTTIDLGSAAAPFRDLYLAGSSATPSANNFKITGTATGARTITLPDSSGTVCLNNSVNCGFLTGTGTAFVQNGNTLGATAVLGTADTNDLQFITNGATRLTLNATGSATFAGNVAINGSTLSSAGALNITPAGTLTVGATNQTLTLQGNASSAITATGGGFTTTVSFTGSPTGAVTYNFDRAATPGTYTICTNAGNCAGAGGGVTTSGGTTNRVAKFTGSQTLGDSSLSDNGSTVTTTGDLVIQGGDATIGVANSQTGVLSLAYGSANFSGSLTQGTLTANRTYTLPDADGTICLSSGNCLGGASGGANTSLSNLTSVAINTSLLPGTTTIDLGSAAAPFRDLYIAGSSATPGSNNFKITGAATAARTITLPDSSGTVCLNNAANCGFATGSGSAFVQNGNTFGATAVLGTNDNNGLELRTNGAAALTLDAAGDATFAGDMALQGTTLSATGALSISSGSTLTLGATAQTLALQGNASTTLSATGGGFTTTVGFTGSPTGAVTYNFDRAAVAGTYTVCSTIGNCAGAGGGVTTSGGTSGTIAVFTGAQSVGDSLLSQSGGTVTASGNLDLTTGNQYRINGAQISSADLSNDSNLAKLNASQTFNGATLSFQNGSNSANSFNIQNAAGNRLLTANTTSGAIVLGTASALDGKLVFQNQSNANTVTIEPGTPTGNHTITLPDADGTICLSSGNCPGTSATLQTAYDASTGGTTPKIKLNSTLNGVDIQDADTTIGADLLDVRASNGSGLGAVLFGVGNTGQITLQNSANSTTAFRVLTQGGTRVATVDTTNGLLTLGQGGTLAGKLVLSNATNANVGTLQTAVLGQDTVYTLPDPAAGSATICLNTGNCLGGASGGANASLSNLTSVAINTTLLPGAAGTINLGSVALPFGDVYLAGTSATPGTNNFKITGASTSGTRTVTLPDASGTVCLQSSASCGFVTGTTNDFIQSAPVSQQTANFNILAPAAGTIAARIEGAANMSTQLVLIKAGSNPSSNALEVQNSGGTQILAVNAGTARVTVGTTCSFGQLCVNRNTTGSPGSTVINMYNQQTINVSGSATFENQHIVMTDTSSAIANTLSPLIIDTSGTTNASATINSIYAKTPASAAGTFLQLDNGSNTVLSVTNAGAATFQPTANGANTFRVNNSTGGYLFNVNTQTNVVGIGNQNVGVFNTNGFYLDSYLNGDIRVGNTNATSVGLGRTGITTTVSGALSVTQATALNGDVTLGDATADLLTFSGVVQGSSPFVFEGATADANETTFAITDPTADRTITFADETGTVCMRSSVSCGFLTGSATDYIQNTTTQQTARYNIQSGNAGETTAFIQGAASASVPTVVVKQGSGQTGYLMQLQDSNGNPLVNFDVNGNQTLANLVASGSVAAPTFASADSTSGATATVTFRSGNTTFAGANSGNVTIDAGTPGSGGTAGTISVGTGNASGVTIGRTGLTTSNAGALTVTQLLTASGGLTVAANQNISMTSGTGTFNQTYSNTTGTASTLAVTNSGSSGTNSVVGRAINLTGTANASGSNTLTGLNFGNVAAATNNSYYGINFGTGFTDLLRYNGTQLISGSGLLQNAAIDSSLTYSNLQKVGALNAGSITSGFGTIATSNTITGTTLNGTTGINTGASAGTQRIDSSGNLVNVGNITGSGAVIIATTGSTNNLALQPAAGASLTGAVTKNAATGNEVAYDLSATINKATSGNYTGIKLNVTETSAPGTGNLLMDLQVGSTSKFSVSSAGTVNIASGQAYQINGQSINTAGTLTNVAYLNQTQSFTGANTFSRNGTGTGDYTLGVTGTPVNDATSSLVRIGGAIASGNSAANGGTYLGINAPGSGAGSAADFLNLQSNGTVRMQLTSGGNLTVGGTYNSNTFTSSQLQFGAASGATIQSASSQALTITANAASIWSTSAGDLDIRAAANLNLGNAGGTTINIGTNNAAHTIGIGNTAATGTQAITIGGSGNTANTLTLEAGTGATAIQIGNGATNHGIQIGTGAAVQTVTLGSTNTTSTATIQGGTGASAVSLQTAATGTIVIGTTNNSTVTLGGSSSVVKLGVLGAATANAVAVCRDSSTTNLIACDAASGAPFIQGGNSFGATGVLGTNDAQSLQFETNNVVRATFTTGNGLYLGLGTTAATPTDFTLAATGSATAGTAGAKLTIQGGAGSSATTGSAGGALELQGGSAAGSGNNLGGNVTITGGTGTGTYASVKGLVVINTPTFQTASTQTCTIAVNPCTITQANIDGNGAVVINASDTSLTVVLPDPTIQTAGRVVYVTAANGSSDFTLSVNGGGTGNTIAMRQNTTATMIWNGSDWTAAGASSSTTLQSAYDSTLSSAGGAEIVLNNTSTSNGLTVRNNATNPIIGGGLLEIQTSIGSNLFTVNNNANDYASNGGAETAGASSTTFPASTWAAAPAGGTATRYVTTGSNIATGVASVFADTTTTANTGVKNTLSASLTQNLKYKVSYTVRHTSSSISFTTLDTIYSADGTSTTATCASGSTVSYSVWTRIDCTFTATSVGASNAIIIRHSDGVEHDFYIDNLSVTVSADVNHAADGSADTAANIGGGTLNWAAVSSSTVSQTTSVLYDSSGAVSVATAATVGRGVYNKLSNNIAPAASTQYRVAFYARGDGTNTATLAVAYTPNNGTNSISCLDYNTQSVAASSYTLVSCYFTTDNTSVSNAQVRITQTGGSATTFYVDALTVTLNTNTASNVQVGGANKGGPSTLFTLDRSSSPPIAANNDAYLGSMYYDTVTGRIQCYESDGWGACGAAPDTTIVYTPEYTGAVLNGSGIGTMTADFCSNETGVLQVNTSFCASHISRNYYKWTSPQSTSQTYSIYVSYKLPSTFKAFNDDGTINLTALADDTSNASVTYEVFRSSGSAISRCYDGITTATAVTSSNNTWQTVPINGNEATGCSFTAGDNVIFKINMTAKSNASVYVENLTFTYTNK